MANTITYVSERIYENGTYVYVYIYFFELFFFKYIFICRRKSILPVLVRLRKCVNKCPIIVHMFIRMLRNEEIVSWCLIVENV